METPKAAELVLTIFARMNREQRKALIQILRGARVKMDTMYPDGVPEAPTKPDSGLILPK